MRRRQAVGILALSPLPFVIYPRRAQAQSSPDKIRIMGSLTEDLTNLYYAMKTGMFQRAGLDVELTGSSSGTAGVEAVMAGVAEMAKTNLLLLFSAHLHSIPLVLVAPDVLAGSKNGRPVSLLQIAADSHYKTGSDLNGKTAGVPSLNGSSALAMKAWMDKNGGDWRTLKFVEIPNSAIVAALTQHRIEVGEVESPELDATLAAGSTKTLGDGLAAIAPTFMLAGYVAASDWASKHADEIHRFNRVLAVATTYVNTHFAETAPLVAELTKVKIADVEAMHRSVNATTLDVTLLQPFIDAAAKYGFISRSFPTREIVWDSAK